MWSFLIVPNHIVSKFLLKLRFVINSIDDSINTFFLQSSVKPFNYSVNPWTSWIDEFMTDTPNVQCVMKYSKEFTPIVGLDCMDGKCEAPSEYIECIACMN